jgi:hypothetical protein
MFQKDDEQTVLSQFRPNAGRLMDLRFLFGHWPPGSFYRPSSVADCRYFDAKWMRLNSHWSVLRGTAQRY